jgi:hypothetical protein
VKFEQVAPIRKREMDIEFSFLAGVCDWSNQKTRGVDPNEGSIPLGYEYSGTIHVETVPNPSRAPHATII